MSGPSERALAAAERAIDEPHALGATAYVAIGAAHDPALGLDGSICKRDVVTWLRELRPFGKRLILTDDVVREFEREFGGTE